MGPCPARWIVAATAVVAAAVPACGGGDPVPDAAEVIDATAGPDADERVCQTPADCPCFSNDDCPADDYCHGDGTNVYCTPGARGTGAPGATCTSELDCASGLCVDDADGGLRCSAVCDDPSDCPASLPRCVFLGGDGLCARPVPP